MSQTRPMSAQQTLITIVVVALLSYVAYSFLTTPDQRSFTDRVGDAFHALPHGFDKASQQLEDRTPGQKLGDEIKDGGQTVKDNTGGN